MWQRRRTRLFRPPSLSVGGLFFRSHSQTLRSSGRTHAIVAAWKQIGLAPSLPSRGFGRTRGLTRLTHGGRGSVHGPGGRSMSGGGFGPSGLDGAARAVRPLRLRPVSGSLIGANFPVGRLGGRSTEQSPSLNINSTVLHRAPTSRLWAIARAATSSKGSFTPEARHVTRTCHQ
jgi:hypothetical protein